MNVVLHSILGLLSICLISTAEAQGFDDGGGSTKLGVEQTGGSNYVAYDLDLAKLKTSDSWKDSAVFHNPSCIDSGSKRIVEDDLRRLRKAGQEKVAIMLWHAHLRQDVVCWGFLINSNRLQNQSDIAGNVRDFTELAGALGFNEVQIRFAPQWINNPSSWSEWNADLFAENEDFISRVLSAVRDGNFKGRIEVDLGVELAGLEGTKFVERYVESIWSDRLTLLKDYRSYGFSLAAGKGRLARYCEWLKKTGHVPEEVGVDIYREIEQAFEDMRSESEHCGPGRPVFVLQETYYDDPAVVRQLANAITAGAIIRTVMQWPLRSGYPGAISEVTTPDFIYRKDEPVR